MPEDFLNSLQSLPLTHWLVYLSVFLPVGFFMNEFGKRTGIACFRRWWQVLTCYGMYLVPVAVALRNQPVVQQYLWGFFFLALLELAGYALGTSQVLGIEENGNTIHIRGNILIRCLNIKNFSLAMSIFFGCYIPAGNWVVANLLRHI